LTGRKDCRSHRVITIDPFDAKDFDDAFYLEKSGDGKRRLWVHIADVSHYVKPGSALDEEARKRGNSTYLVDRVIPMLPEALSNELCSLKPRVDRLTQCAEFELSQDGEVLGVQFYPAVIHSKRRFAYEEAFEVLQREAADEVEVMLHEANRLAQAIRRRRFRDGSLDLDFPEMKIHLNDHGQIDRIVRVNNDVSHQLIEEFMLLANEAVATQLLRQGKVAVHRVHEEPDEERLNDYREEVLSHEVPCGNLQNRNEVQKLLRRLGDLPIGDALKIGFLKSLKRARYAIQPLGHYGLAKKKYAHFTSPIRRYADLVIHRLLNGDSGMTRSGMEKMADHISVTERNSSDAERDSRDVKLFAFLGAQLSEESPQSYDAMVTDIRNFGFFVDVTDLGMSGLVHLSSFENDFFVFDSVRNHLIGRTSKRVIRLGDVLKVQVCKVDTFKKQVDFRAVEEGGSKARVQGRQQLRSGGEQRRRDSRGGGGPRGRDSKRGAASGRAGGRRSEGRGGAAGGGARDRQGERAGGGSARGRGETARRIGGRESEGAGASRDRQGERLGRGSTGGESVGGRGQNARRAGDSGGDRAGSGRGRGRSGRSAGGHGRNAGQGSGGAEGSRSGVARSAGQGGGQQGRSRRKPGGGSRGRGKNAGRGGGGGGRAGRN
jgi:ribonuclease R